MYHMELRKESATKNIPPKIQFGCAENWSLFEVYDECVLKMGGPLYSITTNAPPIDTIVPKTLAWLLKYLQCTSSILNNKIEIVLVFNIAIKSLAKIKCN